MAEIVRLLRWRAEWDGADLVDGANKAAAAGERLKTALGEVGDKGAAGLKRAGTAAKEAESAFDGLGLEAQQVEMYVSRLEKGAGSPLVLKRNAELLEAAFNVLAQSAGRAGQAIPEAFSDRVATAIQNATKQAAGMNAELEKMGGQTPTKLDKVITALEKTEKSSADAWAALRKMGEEGERAAVALARMEKAADSPRELQRAAALAELEMNQLKESIDRARASGTRIAPDIGGALGQASASISAANTRAAQLRDTMGDLKTRGDLAAKGFEAAAGSAGSFEGMLSSLNDTGGKTQQAIAEIGFKLVALGTAAKLGYTEGEKLRQVLADLGVPLPNFSDGLANAYVNLEKVARGAGETRGATDLLSGSLLDIVVKLGMVAAGYGQLEGPESAAISRAREYLTLREQQAVAEQMLRSALSASGTGWKDGYQELDKLNLALADGELRLSRAAGNAKRYAAELRANGEVYAELIAKAEEWGLSVENLAPRIAAAAKSYKESEESKKKATEEFAAKAVESLAKVAAAHEKVVQATQKATTDAVSNYDAQMRALNELQVSEEEYSARKKAIYEEMNTAIEKAAAAEAASAEATKRTQQEVQETLGTTPEKFAEVEKAAAAYNAAIEEGATPTAAMKEAIEGLSTGLFAVATAMGEAGAAAGRINFGGMSVEVKSAAQAAAEAGASLGAMASGLDSIVGSGGRAIDMLNRLKGAFEGVAGASAGAAGGGGPVISNAGGPVTVAK